VASLLAGSASADVTRAAVVDTLLALAALAVHHPAIRSLRIDPLYADDRGVTAVETEITIDPALPRRDRRHGHLAIHPYPADAEKHVTLKDGRPVFIRPIRPDDAALEVAFFESLSMQSRHWRFLHPIKLLTPQMIARFTQVDYDRDMALVALPEAGEAGAPLQMVGVARYVREADASRAEFAIVVADDWQGTGLASALIDQLIAHARLMGLGRLVGHVHTQNLRMLAFMRRHGFQIESSTLEPSLLLATLQPDQDAPAATAAR
jgi:acetyltransferase